MPPVSIMIKPVSGNCNMRCSYCFYIDEMNNRSVGLRGRMSFETLEQTIKEAAGYASGVCTLTFQGGEPTLAGIDFYRNCLSLEKEYFDKSITIYHSFQTNGYDLNEEWCDFLFENHFLVGISIDGIRSSHDCFRKSINGEPTYFRVLENLKLLQQKKVAFNVLTVVNERTSLVIRKIYRKYQELGIHWQQYILCLDSIDRKQNGYAPTPEIYGYFLIELFDMWYEDWKQGKQPYNLEVRYCEQKFAVPDPKVEKVL